MPVETEVKIRVESFDDVRKKLKNLKAKYVSRVHEKNIVYETQKRELESEEVLVRLRREDYEDDGSRTHATFTLKGPKISGGAKKRPEFEVQASDFRRAHRMIEELGFRKALIYEKKRETWVIGKLKVLLDTLPFGSYVELEGDEKDIVTSARKLGFDKKEFITQNYLEIAKGNEFFGDILFG